MFLTKIDHGIPYTDKRWFLSISMLAHSLLRVTMVCFTYRYPTVVYAILEKKLPGASVKINMKIQSPKPVDKRKMPRVGGKKKGDILLDLGPLPFTLVKSGFVSIFLREKFYPDQLV